MRLNEINIRNAGVLNEVRVAGVPSLSVIHGGNGTGKSTLVRFVRDSLLRSDLPTRSYADSDISGTVRLSDTWHHWELTSVRTAEGPQGVVTKRQDDAVWRGSFRDRFPNWLSDQAFQEILTPGYDEVSRFELLTRLCLETGQGVNSGVEIRQTEEAIAQAIGEREGTANEPGIEQQISEMRRHRQQLDDDLQAMRHRDPSLPSEIRNTEDQIAGLQTLIRQIQEDCRILRLEITDLEQQIVNARQQNRLPLDRDQLNLQLADLRDRLTRWRAIRASIEQATTDLRIDVVASPDRAVNSIRAVVSRMEQRMQPNDQLPQGDGQNGVGQETAALCHFVTQQQESLTAWQLAQEGQFGSHAATSIRQNEILLESRINALTEELSRADNILADEMHHGYPHCGSSWHQNYDYRHESTHVSVAALESSLHVARQRLSTLLTNEATQADELHRLQQVLDQQQSQLRQQPSLQEIDDLRARIAECDARLELLNSHRDVLLATEQTLRQVLAKLREPRAAAALDIASPWLRRLTDGECLRIMPNGSRTGILIETSTADFAIPIDQLSRGTQHQLALVLRLALLEVHSATSDRMPMLIDDVFITSDDDRGAAAADLLKEVASGGQQIIMLTCQNDVRGLLAARGATVYSLSEEIIESPQPEPVPVAEPATSLVFKAFDGAAEEFPGELEDVVIDEEDDSHWLFYLEPEHPVSELSGLQISEQNGLCAAGIERIEQLLDCDLSDVKGRMQSNGFLITEERLSELLAQASMSVCVPMLRQRDSELLIAAGIDSVRQMAKLRPEAICELVQRFQNSDTGQRFRRSGRVIDQQQAISWNRWALHARSLDRARTRAAERRRRSGSPSGILSSAQRARIRVNNERERSERTQRKMVRRSDSSNGDRRRAERSLRAQRRQTLSTAAHAKSSGKTATGPGLTFYLDRSSDVEAAPSIGPKTAARLYRVGVNTVDDLLTCDADTVATLLDNRRITSAVIEQWKAQSALVCTIPSLRGHDAQILVACGKSDADEIRHMSAEDLYAIVQPFCETTEGARIVRSGRKPDLREVTDWINWARQSRTLKAA